MCVGKLQAMPPLCVHCVECRDAKHMARDVKSAFVNVLDQHLESSGWLINLC